MDNPDTVVYANYTRTQIFNLIRQYAHNNKSRAAESNRREFISTHSDHHSFVSSTTTTNNNNLTTSNSSFIDNHHHQQQQEGIIRTIDLFNTYSSNNSTSTSCHNLKINPNNHSHNVNINNDSDLSDVDEYFNTKTTKKSPSLSSSSTCARTSFARIDRSTQMRRHVTISHGDEALARSTMLNMNQSPLHLEMMNVPDLFISRIAHLWYTLNVQLDYRYAVSITIHERIWILHLCIRHIELGYKPWLLHNQSNLHPYHHLIYNQLMDLTYEPIEIDNSLFTLALDSRHRSLGISQALYLSLPDQLRNERKRSDDPIPRDPWIRSIARALQVLEYRLIRIEQFAPLWFTIHCKYPSRPTSFPPVLEPRPKNLGGRWTVIYPPLDSTPHSH